MKQTKILHLCLCGGITDGQTYQDNLLTRYHVLMGLDVAVIASTLIVDGDGKLADSDVLDEYVNADGVRIRRLPYKGGILNRKFRRFIGLAEALERESPDILFIHGCQFADISIVVKYLKCSKKKIDVYVDNHADFSNSVRNVISWLLNKTFFKYGCAKRIEPYAKKFYGVLPARGDFLRSMYGIKDDKIDLLVMGMDDLLIEDVRRTESLLQIRSKLSLGEKDFVLVTGGKFGPEKNIDLLLKAFHSIPRPNLKLIVFGSPTRDVKPEFDRLIRNDRIRYVGWIGSDDIYKYFLASDLVIFPGLHSVLWEQAVGAGIPCIFKKIPGTRHVDVGGNCLFIDPVTVETIRDAILKVVDDRELLGRMRQVAQDRGAIEFSYRDIARRSIDRSFCPTPVRSACPDSSPEHEETGTRTESNEYHRS